MNGYSTALSFKNFEVQHIEEVESFVKNELMDLFTEKCRIRNLTFEENDKVFFFGIYASDHNKFRFVGGDKSIIKEMVEHVKKKIDENGTEYFANVTVRAKHKIFLEDTCKLSIGTYFAKKKRTVDITIASAGEHLVNEADMKSNVFINKLKPIFDVMPEMPTVHPINENIIYIIKNGVKVSADVIRPFCPGKKCHRIQCDQSAKSNMYYWNISNFKKHLRKHEINVNKKIDNDENDNNTFIDDETNTRMEDLQVLASKSAAQNHTNMRLKRESRTNQRETIIPAKKKPLDDIGELQNTIFRQISKQNLFIMSTTLKYNEKEETMNFKLDLEEVAVSVSAINPNGACLFGTFAHQIYGCQIDSVEHQQKTAELREMVVKHIQQNFENFKFHLKGRVYEKLNRRIDPSEIDSECRIFLNACLSRPNCHGGTESIFAISEIMGINIITIKENGDCHMSTEFDSKLKRTIFLAHRLSGLVEQNGSTHNDDRNHYDSVTKIESDVLFKICGYLKEKNDVKLACHANDHSVVSLNSTIS